MKCNDEIYFVRSASDCCGDIMLEETRVGRQRRLL